MKIIVFGSNGMLGNYILSYFLKTSHNVIPLTRSDYDVMEHNFEDLEKTLINNNIDDNTLVVNAIGIIPHASKQYNITKHIYIKVNTLFPQVLSQLCSKYNAKMIHATTDCVYTGKSGSYTELDKSDVKDTYGITKHLGEPTNCTVIRTSIIGEETRNKRSLVEWIKSNDHGKIHGYLNHMWNGITCLQFAKIIDKIIVNDMFWNGVRHIYSPNTVNKYELVQMINNVYKLNIDITPINADNEHDKSISSIYDISIFAIPTLNKQIMEMYQFAMLLKN